MHLWETIEHISNGRKTKLLQDIKGRFFLQEIKGGKTLPCPNMTGRLSLSVGFHSLTAPLSIKYAQFSSQVDSRNNQDALAMSQEYKRINTFGTWSYHPRIKRTIPVHLDLLLVCSTGVCVCQEVTASPPKTMHTKGKLNLCAQFLLLLLLLRPFTRLLTPWQHAL